MSIIYFTFPIIFQISAFFTVSIRYSFVFWGVHFCTETLKLSISFRDIDSKLVSKYFIVKKRNAIIITQRIVTANTFGNMRIIPENISHISDPTQNVILFRASIFQY